MVIADVARSPLERMRGLSTRERLNEGEGMIFMYSRPTSASVQMFDMRFALDIVWILQRRVVEVSACVPAGHPELVRSQGQVDCILELPANFCRQNDIAAGSAVVIVDQPAGS